MSKNKPRGFAALNEEQRREIARKGGQAAQQKGKGHRFTPEEARRAGRKGGQTVSQNREHMARIGRGGGARSGSVRRSAAGGARPPRSQASSAEPNHS